MPKSPYEILLEESSPATSTPYDTISNELYDMSPYQDFLADAYGYPESSLNMEDDQYYGYLSMGDKELKEQQSVGFFNSLIHGIGSGATLGHMQRFGIEPLDDKAMTTAEMGAQVVGELGGGLLPFIAASSIIGTVGAPIALAGGAMATAYKAISKIGKIEKQISRIVPRLQKLKQQDVPNNIM